MRVDFGIAPRALVSCGCALLAWLLLPRVACAWVLQVPAGADAITLPDALVLCGATPEGFSIDPARRRLRPHARAQVGRVSEVQLAPTLTACGTPAARSSTLIVTGKPPSFDANSVTLLVDAGRLELRGDGLEGASIAWTAESKTASDTCNDVGQDKGRDSCTLRVDDDLPADPKRVVLHWSAAGGRFAPDAVQFDLRGQALTDEQTRVPIARVLIRRMFPPSPTLNVASGEGRVQLEHAEAISGVECSGAHCELGADGVSASAIAASAANITVRLRLLPHVFLVHGDAQDASVNESVSVLRCPLTLVSGDPLRNVDDVQILVRLDPSCGRREEALRWTINGDSANVTRSEGSSEGTYFLLWAGHLSSDHIDVLAARGDSVLAVTSARTAEAPKVATALALPGYGEIDFIPKNRDALLSVSHAAGAERLVPISVPGAYTVSSAADGFRIRGVYASGGFTALRFAYRVTQVPESFADVDFARVIDPVQRPIREANVPAPIGGSSVSDHPVVELFCLDAHGQLSAIASGLAVHIPFARRDSCRLEIHRERIAEDDGEQRLDVDVSVNAVGGEERGEAHLTQHLALRHGDQRDVIWVRGAKQQFDRITIRITHVVEGGYVIGANSRLDLPSSQWTVVTEDAHFKFYATAAIPASLYRFSSDPGDLGTGPLSLNFGVLSRLTWLDSDGHEGLVGAEAGMMGMGLATDRERQLALVMGLGIAIPIGNPNQLSQAAINIHAWAAYSVGKRSAPLLDDMGAFKREVTLNPWAFVFGPSITIGSVGVFM